MTTTFENAKVGDRVYSLVAGWTTIKYIGNERDDYPIRINVGNKNEVFSGHTMNGIVLAGGDQVLFWDKPTITAPPKPEAPPVDTLVEVKEGGEWKKRYSAGRLDEEGSLFCWNSGATSLTTDGMKTCWLAWRIPQDNDGWIEWNGGECPVHIGTLVDVKHKNGKIYTSVKAGIFGSPAKDWFKSDYGTAIVAYRISK